MEGSTDDSKVNKDQTGQKIEKWSWKLKKSEENEIKRCSGEETDCQTMWK